MYPQVQHGVHDRVVVAGAAVVAGAVVPAAAVDRLRLGPLRDRRRQRQ